MKLLAVAFVCLTTKKTELSQVGKFRPQNSIWKFEFCQRNISNSRQTVQRGSWTGGGREVPIPFPSFQIPFPLALFRKIQAFCITTSFVFTSSLFSGYCLEEAKPYSHRVGYPRNHVTHQVPRKKNKLRNQSLSDLGVRNLREFTDSVWFFFRSRRRVVNYFCCAMTALISLFHLQV